jgi:hypothetical protein
MNKHINDLNQKTTDIINAPLGSYVIHQPEAKQVARHMFYEIPEDSRLDKFIEKFGMVICATSAAFFAAQILRYLIINQ